MKIWLYFQELIQIKVVLLTWVIAGGLATFAGVLYGLDKIYKPFIFLQMLLPIFLLR